MLLIIKSCTLVIIYILILDNNLSLAHKNDLVFELARSQSQFSLFKSLARTILFWSSRTVVTSSKQAREEPV